MVRGTVEAKARLQAPEARNCFLLTPFPLYTSAKSVPVVTPPPCRPFPISQGRGDNKTWDRVSLSLLPPLSRRSARPFPGQSSLVPVCAFTWTGERAGGAEWGGRAEGSREREGENRRRGKTRLRIGLMTSIDQSAIAQRDQWVQKVGGRDCNAREYCSRWTVLCEEAQRRNAKSAGTDRFPSFVFAVCSYHWRTGGRFRWGNNHHHRPATVYWRIMAPRRKFRRFMKPPRKRIFF